MSAKNPYRHTLYASYIGISTQAIVNNFIPLLFLTLEKELGISLSQITLLTTFNFAVQLIIDFLAARFVDRIGYKSAVMIAQFFEAAGLACLTFLPSAMPDAYWGVLISVVLYAIGGGLLEVVASPIVEACPTEHKEASMSLMHSFYCWGHMFVVLVSTAFFAVWGVSAWRVLALFWAAVPFLNAFYFLRVPVNSLPGGEGGGGLKGLFRQKLFWVLALLMVCAGASEQGMSQWASAFAESGLGVSKTVGDLLGPCLFAGMMGLSRVFYSQNSEKISLKRYMAGSGTLCVVGYLLSAFSPSPLLGLMGCGLCGLSVGILWPGVCSLSAKALPLGGTAMFAMLALAGDLGCSSGPTLVGFAAGAMNGSLRMGFLAALVFPVGLIWGLRLLTRTVKS